MDVIKKLLIVLLLLFCSQQVVAQEDRLSKNNNGSFYSLFGVGFPFDHTTARESGLGVLGVSLDNMESNSLQNPALWGLNTYTTASSGLKLSRFFAEDENAESLNALLEAGYLQITLPLLKQKLGVSAALYPVTKSSYRIFSTDMETVFNDLAQTSDTIQYVTDIRGSGGVNKLEFGLGWNINKYISVGYAPSLAFITRSNSENVFFQQSGYNASMLDSRITGVTFAQRFGTLLSFSRLLNRNDRLTIGAAVALPINFDAELKTNVFRNIDNQSQEVELSSQKGNLKLPIEINSGLTYYPSNFVNISVEGQLQQWSEFESEFNSGGEQYMSDRYRLGLGAEFHPYKFNSANLMSGFRYSAGVSYDSGHLQIDNEKIDTFWISAGLGIPTRTRGRSISSVDISFQYGIRGTTQKSLVQENIWAINLSVNLAELMFIRPKLN